MEVLIRRTSENDFSQTEFITREILWNPFKPGCVEHLILHNLRKSNCCIATRLADITGKFFEDDAFETQDDALIEFEKNYPDERKSGYRYAD